MESPSSERVLPRVPIIVAVAIAIVMLAEVLVRVRASALPPPQKWLGPEMTLKEVQIRDLQRAGGASVIFLGSSTVDVSIDPALISRRDGERPIYNAATGAGSMRMISTWAQVEAVPRLSPDVVVLGMVSRELNDNDPEQDELERDFYAAPAVRDLLDTESVMQRAERHVESASDLFKYRSVVRQPRFFRAFLGLPEASAGTAYGEIVSSNGQYQAFLHNAYRNDAAVRERFAIGALNRYHVGSRQIMTLRRLLEFLKLRTKHVVVVAMPVTKDYVAMHPMRNADHRTFIRTLRLQAERSGATYIDAGVWPTRFFADPAHLNAQGSQRITKMLDRTLAALPPW